ncbi:thioredoxin domain-containing protein [Chlorogloeopsis sp. ULAP01]|uniref:DsbA family protein n=1 Tax=Chlorogloeopsis sp. ULAP01 TaxID=3056483 RepID=UPI0025AA6A79|nr:thioredoxin domain-containing protein [Chlorogloeopsis sp. ULAP01]MDM9384432.1 thioredoxin domain-containing protein [Chlorogloeopsis sp. ULAP01]
MRILFSLVGQLLQRLLTLTVIASVCLVLVWSFPVQAASRINPQLEEQVLQIIRNHPEAILESVQVYQQEQQQELQQTRQAFLQDLKFNPQKVIGDSPTTGANTPKILLVEFSDFQCPYCAEAHKTLKNLIAKHQDKVKLVYKNFPLISIHAEAMPAAEAAWAAQQQGKFWEYHDSLFNNQKKIGDSLYVDIAKKLNLDLEKFEKDRQIANNVIQKDIQLADNLGLSGTPFFIMNSDTVSGVVQLSKIEEILTSAK